MENKRILLIGGTGYIGSRLYKSLSSYDVTLMTRQKVNHKHFIGDVLNPETLKKIRNFDLIINLASIVKSINKSKYNQNIKGLQNLINQMNDEKISNIIWFSTQNTNLKNKGFYARSKEKCEELLINSNLKYIIIKPNYVYGIDKKNEFYKTSRIIKKFNLALIAGKGNTVFEPIFIDDLVRIIVNLIENFKSNEIIEVSGGEQITFNDIVDKISEKVEKKPLKIHIPILFLKLFKYILPFDVEGIDENRTSNNNFNFKYSKIDKNIEKIVKLK